MSARSVGFIAFKSNEGCAANGCDDLTMDQCEAASTYSWSSSASFTLTLNSGRPYLCYLKTDTGDYCALRPAPRLP